VKNFSFNEKETSDGPRRREHAQKYAIDPKGSNFHIKAFSFNKKETSDGPQRREQAPELCP